MGMLQGCIWNTWGPIDESAKVAFGFSACMYFLQSCVAKAMLVFFSGIKYLTHVNDYWCCAMYIHNNNKNNLYNIYRNL